MDKKAAAVVLSAFPKLVKGSRIGGASRPARKTRNASSIGPALASRIGAGEQAVGDAEAQGAHLVGAAQLSGRLPILALPHDLWA
jgi:hypothetical protein